MSSSSGTTSATVWSSSNAASKHGDDPASGTTTKEEPIPDEPASGTTTNEEPIPDEPASETTTKEEPIPDEPASRTTTNEEPIPDVPAISNANVPSALLQSMQQDFQDAKIKKEGDKVVLNSKERAFRQTELRALIKANRDPQGNPRFVFRRGCSVSITTVLGGQGVHPWPIVKNVPDMGKDFISAGEFYFAGVEHFNHFVPKYPGAKGFIDSTALWDNRKSQPTFHVFVQCSQQRYHKYWYGTNAKGGYLYVGKYKIADDEVETLLEFAPLDLWYQNGIAEWYLARPHHGYYSLWKDNQAHYTNLAKQGLSQAEWNNMDEHQREICEMRAMLVEEKWVLELTPVEFVSYDEDLYQTLVNVGAAKVTKTQTGRVSIDPVELGYPAGLL